MTDLSLDPYAATLHWSQPADAAAALTPAAWEALLTDFLANLGRACQAGEAGLIGHIKALALFPQGGFLRLSVVSPTRPPSHEGRVPADCREVVLTLNLIVYGRERRVLAALTRRVAQETAAGLCQVRLLETLQL